MQLFWLGTLVNIAPGLQALKADPYSEALSTAKLALAQLAEQQKALKADAVHGLGDSLAEVLTAFAYVEAARPPDVEHPWGHGKIESMGAVVARALEEEGLSRPEVTCILLYIAFSMGQALAPVAGFA